MAETEAARDKEARAEHDPQWDRAWDDMPMASSEPLTKEQKENAVYIEHDAKSGQASVSDKAPK